MIRAVIDHGSYLACVKLLAAKCNAKCLKAGTLQNNVKEKTTMFLLITD